eukprot:9002314-Karenia_brevis.AAC.1
MPKEAKHNRQGYAEWVDRILNQKEGYRMAHNWTRGTPKAPPLPTSATYDGIVHYFRCKKQRHLMKWRCTNTRVLPGL